MEQPAFADLEYRGKRRRTRRGPFLEGQGPVQSGGTGPELQLRRRQLQKQGDSARGGEFAGFRRWFDKKAFPAPMPQVPCKELIPFADGPEHTIIRA